MAHILMTVRKPQEATMADEKPTFPSFTLREMREAYIKYLEGKPLTQKEAELAKTKAIAVAWINRGA